MPHRLMLAADLIEDALPELPPDMHAELSAVATSLRRFGSSALGQLPVHPVPLRYNEDLARRLVQIARGLEPEQVYDSLRQRTT
ncbi:MAG: hypothetical protein RLY86_11 [Pseudomonadota bacterium]|jgi:hypothetical protein